MARTLYSPRLSDDVIRVLYKEGKRRHIPMTRLADELILVGLATKQPPSEQTPHDKPADLPVKLVIPGEPAA